MTSLKYKDKDGFWQELPVGTNVVANPIIAGTESELTGLQVGDAKYKMPAGGGKLYIHTIRMTVDYDTHEGAIAVVRSQRQNAYTLEDLVNDIIGCTIARYRQGDNGFETSYLSLVYGTTYLGDPDYNLVLTSIGSNNTFDISITNLVSDIVTEA